MNGRAPSSEESAEHPGDGTRSRMAKEGVEQPGDVTRSRITKEGVEQPEERRAMRRAQSSQEDTALTGWHRGIRNAPDVLHVSCLTHAKRTRKEGQQR